MSAVWEDPDNIKPLCDRCQSVVVRAHKMGGKETEARVDLKVTAQDLKSSAETCSFCETFTIAIFRDAYTDFPERQLEEQTLIIHLQKKECNETPLMHATAELSFKKDDLYYPVCGSHFPTLVIRDPSTFLHYGHHRQGQGIRFEETIERIKKWLRICDSEHICATQHPLTVRPRRLIDVMPDLPVVVVTKDIAQQNLDYLCLSHCWGDQQHLPRLTSNTEQLYKVGIPSESLPKTYKDAIAVSRALGFRYLWIDSLCILQDNVADWQRESSNMGYIYASCRLQLAATAAHDGSVGFCIGNVPQYPERISGSLSLPNDLGESSRCIATICSPEDERDFATHNVLSAPLNKRGWVFQECLLSPRTVYFVDGQVYWECRKAFYSEDGLVNAANVALARSSLKHMPWRELVVEYSNRKFTFKKDRMAAMAGLITEYAAREQDEPILGLWRKSLHHDLYWQNGNNYPPKPVARVVYLRHVPTWSWLSVESEIRTSMTFRNNHGDDDTVLLSVEGWSVEWSATPYSSQLLSAVLILTGPARRGPHEVFEGAMKPGINAFPEDTNHHTFCADAALAGEDVEDVVLLGLISTPEQEFCLALLPVLEDEVVRYKRVGVARVNTKELARSYVADRPKQTLTLI